MIGRRYIVQKCFLVSVLLVCFGCEKKEIAEQRLRTVLLANGGVSAQLAILGPFHEIKDDKGNVQIVWVSFEYPSMALRSLNEAASANTVDVEIRLLERPSLPSTCDAQFNRIVTSGGIDPASRPLTRVGQQAVFESVNPVDKKMDRNYFFRHGDGELVCFGDSTLRATATRQYAQKFELHYIFPKQLLPNKIDVDTSVTTLVASFLKKSK